MKKADEQGNKPSNKAGKGARVGRSRTLLLPAHRTGSRVRFREKDGEDEKGFPEPLPTTPRSLELKWMREVKSERHRGALPSTQRSSLSSLPLGIMHRSFSSVPSPGTAGTSTVAAITQKSGSRNSPSLMTESHSGNKAEKQLSGRSREHRSRSLVIREPRRRRSSTTLSSIYAPHISGKGVMLQECSSSSRDSDGSRSRPSSSHELGRSASDRVKTRGSYGSKKEGTMRSPLRSPWRSPYTDRSHLANLELAMALPEEETIEQMLRLKSDCSGSETETASMKGSMKGLVSSLIAIENEEM